MQATVSAARDGPGPARPSSQVLADRLAAGLTRREPGYPLPRRTALARRLGATPAEIDAAVEELIRRQLLRRLPTGQVHRAGPAEMFVSLDGLPGLSSLIDPLDHRLSCAAARTSRLRAPADVADVLRLVPGALVCVRRCLWTADGEPAATVATYVPDEHCDLITGPSALGRASGWSGPLPLVTALEGTGAPDPPRVALRPGAVRVEVQPPTRAIARRLRLVSGAPAVTVTARLDSIGRSGGTDPGSAADPVTDPVTAADLARDTAGCAADDSDPAGTAPAAHDRQGARSGPVALTVLVLRADLFRIVLDTERPGDPAALRGASGHLPSVAGTLEPRCLRTQRQDGSAYRGTGAT